MGFFDLLLIGLTQGCIYGLIALGFVLIYKSTEMINFAQGDLAIFGAFFAIYLMQEHGFNFWQSLAICLPSLFVFGFLLDRFLIRQLLGHPTSTVVILTIALGLVLRSIIGALWGYEPRSIATPYSGRFEWLGFNLDHNQLVLIGVTILVCFLLAAFFRFSKWGLAIKASSQNQLAAYYSGIPVRRLYSLVWGLGAVLATVAGILLASTSLVDPHTGFIGLKAFAAAVVAGLGSLPGAMLGGILIGLAEQFAGQYLPDGSQEVTAYLLMILILFLKPSGIISQVQMKKV